MVIKLLTPIGPYWWRHPVGRNYPVGRIIMIKQNAEIFGNLGVPSLVLTIDWLSSNFWFFIYAALCSFILLALILL